MPEDFVDFPAPWEIYPEIPHGSIHWRMGSGESAMDEWWPKMRALTQEQRLAYRRMHPGPVEWVKWLDDVISEWPKQKDKSEIASVIPFGAGEVLINLTFHSSDRAEVKTAKIRAGQLEGGRVFSLRRKQEGWEIQKSLTKDWAA